MEAGRTPQLGKMEKVQMEVEGECRPQGGRIKSPTEGLPELDGRRGLAAPANTPRAVQQPGHRGKWHKVRFTQGQEGGLGGRVDAQHGKRFKDNIF